MLAHLHSYKKMHARFSVSFAFTAALFYAVPVVWVNIDDAGLYQALLAGLRQSIASFLLTGIVVSWIQRLASRPPLWHAYVYSGIGSALVTGTAAVLSNVIVVRAPDPLGSVVTPVLFSLALNIGQAHMSARGYFKPHEVPIFLYAELVLIVKWFLRQFRPVN